MKTTRLISASILMLAFFLVFGCGPKLNKVGGIVMIDGKPLTHGTILVAPEGGRAAHGVIGTDGRFTLTTNDDNDGIIVGSHNVVVRAGEGKNGGIFWHAPKKYADFKTSKLKVDVSGPTTELKINLSWEGGQPFLEPLNKE